MMNDEMRSRHIVALKVQADYWAFKAFALASGMYDGMCDALEPIIDDAMQKSIVETAGLMVRDYIISAMTKNGRLLNYHSMEYGTLGDAEKERLFQEIYEEGKQIAANHTAHKLLRGARA